MKNKLGSILWGLNTLNITVRYVYLNGNSKLYCIGSTEYTEHFKEIINQHDGTFTIVS